MPLSGRVGPAEGGPELFDDLASVLIDGTLLDLPELPVATAVAHVKALDANLGLGQRPDPAAATRTVRGVVGGPDRVIAPEDDLVQGGVAGVGMGVLSARVHPIGPAAGVGNLLFMPHRAVPQPVSAALPLHLASWLLREVELGEAVLETHEHGPPARCIQLREVFGDLGDDRHQERVAGHVNGRRERPVESGPLPDD